MVNVFQKKILIVAVYAAEIMMRNGAEIYRVEDTVTRICKAGRIKHVEVFATPTGIFVSMDSGDENGRTGGWYVHGTPSLSCGCSSIRGSPPCVAIPWG